MKKNPLTACSAAAVTQSRSLIKKELWRCAQMSTGKHLGSSKHTRLYALRIHTRLTQGSGEAPGQTEGSNTPDRRKHVYILGEGILFQEEINILKNLSRSGPPRESLQ